MAVPYVLNPGKLRQSVQIQAPVTTPGTYGLSVAPSSFNTILTARAGITTAGGRETSQASQLVSDVSHVVTIRYTATVIKAGFRVLFGARYFIVQYVENVEERNRVLLLYCLEVDGGGQ